MDLHFFRRAEQRLASQSAARVDFGMLVAMLQTQQSASPASRAQAQCQKLIVDPLVEILLAGSGWRRAVKAQGGCFNARLAGYGKGRASSVRVLLGDDVPAMTQEGVN